MSLSASPYSSISTGPSKAWRLPTMWAKTKSSSRTPEIAMAYFLPTSLR